MLYVYEMIDNDCYILKNEKKKEKIALNFINFSSF
jgi:hypothetical protein